MYFKQYSQIQSFDCLPYSSGYGLKYQVSISKRPICILSMYFTFVICSCSFSKAAVVGSISAYLRKTALYYMHFWLFRSNLRFLNVINFVMPSLLVSSDFSVWAIRQKISDHRPFFPSFEIRHLLAVRQVESRRHDSTPRHLKRASIVNIRLPRKVF